MAAFILVRKIQEGHVPVISAVLCSSLLECNKWRWPRWDLPLHTGLRLPACDFLFRSGNPVMEMIRLSSMEQYHSLPKNQWNIKQPPDDEQIESVFDRGALDLVLTPGLAFTRKGDRLGRGKGYYDSFLARCKRELPSFPYTMGLALTEQILPEIPTDQHDFPLDLVVSPQ